MEKETKYFLECEVFPGIFSEEKFVKFKDANGNYVSGFWPDSKIKQNKLEISLREVKGNKALIFGPFPDGGGYGFFQGSGFYVNSNLISEIVE